jgi:hypothetical protein
LTPPRQVRTVVSEEEDGATDPSGPRASDSSLAQETGGWAQGVGATFPGVGLCGGFGQMGRMAEDAAQAGFCLFLYIYFFLFSLSNSNFNPSLNSNMCQTFILRLFCAINSTKLKIFLYMYYFYLYISIYIFFLLI